MMSADLPVQRNRAITLFWWVLAGVLATRLITLGLYPLTDTTEARYAEIARLMLATGDWITPQLEAGVPFWGKPPLYAWLTAISFAVFGVNEFAARLPQFVLSLGVLWLVWRLLGGRAMARMSVVVLASTFMFFVAAGAVMTDMALLFCTTLSMTGFWLAQNGKGRWSLAFFAGLGLGLLAKGPIALVLIGLPLALWLVIYRQWRSLGRLSWETGIALTLAIALPWYFAAEIRTPGFLNYFIVGEHVLRFVQPGWAGDLYGSAHDQPRGSIWLYGLLATLPWTPLFFFYAFKVVRSGQALRFWSAATQAQWRGYLLCWMLAPMLFFSLAGNILPAYVLPGIPAFAIMMAGLIRIGQTDSSRRYPIRAMSLATVTPLLLVGLLGLHLSGNLRIHTEKPNLQRFDVAKTNSDDTLYYFGDRPMSAAFYSQGRAQTLPDDNILTGANGPVWVAARRSRQQELPNECRRAGEPTHTRYQLFVCTETPRTVGTQRRR